jgi:hypothetical protein
MNKASFLRQIFMCPLNLCGMTTAGNETHLWGECPRCGKRAGVVSREAVRRYMKAKEMNEQIKAKLDAERDAIIHAGQRK